MVDELPTDIVRAVQCILTVVNKHEFQGVFRLLQPVPSERRILKAIIHSVTVYVGKFSSQIIALVQSAVSNQSVGSISNTIHSLLRTLSPHAIISVGVAFGASTQKQQLGDVLVSTLMIDYSSTRINPDGNYSDRGVRTEAGRNLLDRCRAAVNEFASKVISGPILSGPVLYDNAEAKRALLARHTDAVGGEMEGVGLYTAAEAHNVEWIIIKAICDWGDGTKEKAWQPYCAHQAAQFVHHVLANQNVWQGFPVFLRDVPLPALVEADSDVPYINRLRYYVHKLLLCELRDNLVCFPAENVVKFVLEQDGLIMRGLDLARDDRFKSDSWHRDQWSTLFLPSIVAEMDQHVRHAVNWHPNHGEIERAMCVQYKVDNNWPAFHICLLRVLSKDLSSSSSSQPRFKLYNAFYQSDADRYLSDYVVTEIMSSALPPYGGDCRSHTEIRQYLFDNHVEMVDLDNEPTSSDQISKCSEWLRRRCFPARMLTDTQTSYALACMAGRWRQDFVEVRMVTVVAMNIALIAQGYRVKIASGDRRLLNANVKWPDENAG